ncbi:hypothetical protein [Thermus sp.]|uniref:hypothetical protein n=1 Tax=Thermus sp. TaxID=275 RepID=UPI00343961B4
MRRLSDRYGGRISWVRRSENYRAAPTKWLGFLPAPQDIYDFLQSLSPSDRQAAVNALRDQVVLPYVDNAPIGSPASPLPGVRLDPAPNPNQWTDNPFTRPDIDTDGDGWPDSIEWHEANRRGVDWPNLINNPTAYPDPQADPDGDGYTTGEEVQVGTDPYNPSSRPQRRSPVSPATDTDGDGWPDEEEIRRGTDPRNPNSRPTPTSPLEDTDGDGWPDEEEVRRGTDPRNPNSRPTGTPPSQDTDGDGWPDVEEIRRGTDPLNPNSRPTGTPPLRDTDGDGWPDEEEIRRGTDPTNPNSRPTPVPPLQDTDGDGWPDEEEIRRGTDPRNPQDKPEEANEPQWPGGPPPGRLEPVQLPQTPTEAQRPLPRLSDLEQIAQAWRTQVVDRLSRALRELQDTARTRFPFSVGWTLQVNYGSTPCSFPFTIGQWTAQIAICDTPIWQAATTFRPFLAGLLFLGVAYALIRRSLDVQR